MELHSLEERIWDAWVRICSECERNFDLRNGIDCEEWYAGHDCEVRTEPQQYTNKEVNK
jgi:hypothetical protein